MASGSAAGRRGTGPPAGRTTVLRGCPGAGLHAVLPQRAEGRGHEGVRVAEEGAGDRTRTPPGHRLPAHPHAAPVPLQVTVVGGHQRRAPVGEREQVGGHHRVAERQQLGQAAGGLLGHRGVVAQQPDGRTREQASLLRRGQLRRLRVEHRHQVVGDQPQATGLRGPPDGLGRVHHGGRIRPAIVGAEQLVEPVVRQQAGVGPGGEVVVQPGEGRPGTGGFGDLQGTVETSKPDLLAGGAAVVVRAHPAHQLPVTTEGAPLVAEAAGHDVVEPAGAGHDVFVHEQGSEAVDLEGDRPVTLDLDELPEGVVAGVEQWFRAVGGLAEGQEPGPGLEQRKQRHAAQRYR